MIDYFEDYDFNYDENFAKQWLDITKRGLSKKLKEMSK